MILSETALAFALQFKVTEPLALEVAVKPVTGPGTALGSKTPTVGSDSTAIVPSNVAYIAVTRIGIGTAFGIPVTRKVVEVAQVSPELTVALE